MFQKNKLTTVNKREIFIVSKESNNNISSKLDFFSASLLDIAKQEIFQSSTLGIYYLVYIHRKYFTRLKDFLLSYCTQLTWMECQKVKLVISSYIFFTEDGATVLATKLAAQNFDTKLQLSCWMLRNKNRWWINDYV